MPPPSHLLVVSPVAALRRERIEAWLAALGKEGRSTEIRILGATRAAATEIVHAFAARHGAVFGWATSTLAQEARDLAAPRLRRSGLLPAPPLALEAVAARVVHRLTRDGALGRFTPVAHFPGLPRALTRTLHELRAGGVGAIDDPSLDAVRVAYEEELRALGFADRADVLRFAIQAAEEGGPRGAPIVLADCIVESGLDRELCEALTRSAISVLATAPEGDDRTIANLSDALGVSPVRVRVPSSTARGRIQERLFVDAPHDGADVDDGDVFFFSAPGESRESVEIARLVQREAARGVPFDRMAILLRATEAYRPHLAEALRRASIPAYFAEGAVAPDPAGRAFLALLDCAAERLSARRFAEYLSLDQVPKHGDAGADDAPRVPRRWEKLLVEASVIGGGLGRWERRLDAMEHSIAREIEAATSERRADAARRDHADLAALRRFALPLLGKLAELPDEASWSVWLRELAALATAALAKPGRVEALLAELHPMEDVGPVDIHGVRQVLEKRLVGLVGDADAARAGAILVAPIDRARGLSFEVVFVPGLAERMFPQKVTEDPILRDRLRAAAGLTTNEDRIANERLALRVAVGATSDRLVVSYPRLDLEGSRPRVPSFYGLEIMRAAEGTLSGFDALARRAEAAVGARIGWPAPRRPELAIDDAEYDLAQLEALFELPEDRSGGSARYLLAANAHLARALRFRARRWTRGWWPADGLVDPTGIARAALDLHAIGARSYAPTTLEAFARCPYQFYLSAIQRLSPRRAPEAVDALDPAQRGSLVHEALHELGVALVEAGLAPLEEARLGEALALVEPTVTHVAHRFEQELAPAIPRVWEDGIAALRADLREWVRRLVPRASSGDIAWAPWRFELAFGRDGHEPVELEHGLRLTGSIDLVERSAAGTLRATDYKTGARAAERAASEDLVIGGGEILQPLLYAAALERLFPDAPVDEGRLYFCTDAGDFADRHVAFDERARASLGIFTETLTTALAGGFLPAAPRPGACDRCDYRSICGPHEEQRIKRKAQERLVPLRALRKLP